METHKGCIFNIQKFSIHDGPGIRTVIFFKGCPLRCEWCSNPESQAFQPDILWDETLCTYCLTCQKECPNGVIENKINRRAASLVTNKGNIMKRNSKKCDGCHRCLKECPNSALKSVGELKTIDEISYEVLKDYEFYIESGGGITLSGGEFLLQHEFAKQLLIHFKSFHLHTACETTGYANSSVFAKLLPHIDLLLFDLKHYNDELHKKYTGVSQLMILDNLKLAVQSEKHIVVRIPVIPSVNNSLTDAEQFCILLQRIGITEVELLPFHQFGEKKYELLGKKYKMKNSKQLDGEELIPYQKIFLDYGMRCRIS